MFIMNKNTVWFEIKEGAKQESILSPRLFSIVMEVMIRKLKSKAKVMVFENGNVLADKDGGGA